MIGYFKITFTSSSITTPSEKYIGIVRKKKNICKTCKSESLLSFKSVKVTVWCTCKSQHVTT